MVLPAAHDNSDDGSRNTGSSAERPSWTTPAQALRVVAYRPHLRGTVRIALTVGTALFVINQLDVVLRGNATTVTWLKGLITYLVPFTVSNLGILTATRSPDPQHAGSPHLRRGRRPR